MSEYISVNKILPKNGQKVFAKFEGVYKDRKVVFWRDSRLIAQFGRIDEPDGKGSQPATHWRLDIRENY